MTAPSQTSRHRRPPAATADAARSRAPHRRVGRRSSPSACAFRSSAITPNRTSITSSFSSGAGRSRSPSRRSSSCSSSCGRWRAPTGGSGSTASAPPPPAAWAARWCRRRARARARPRRRAARVAFGRYFGPFALGLVILFPFISLGLLGPGGLAEMDQQLRRPDSDLRDAGLGTEHRGRPRRPSRSRLRRLLRGRRLFLCAALDHLRPFVLDLPAARRNSRRDVGRHSRLPGPAGCAATISRS